MDLLFHRPPFLPIHTIQKKRGQGFGKPKSLWKLFFRKVPPPLQFNQSSIIRFVFQRLCIQNH